MPASTPSSWSTSANVAATAAMLVCGAVIAACSSASDDERSVPKVEGSYAGAGAGAIEKLLLANGQYTMLTSDCGGDATPCARSGTYAIDEAGGSIAFKDAASGRTMSVAFAVLESRELAAAPRTRAVPLQPRGLCLVGSWESMGCCVRNPTGCSPRPEGGAGSELLPGGQASVVPGGQVTLVVQCTGNCAVTITVGGETLSATGEQVNVTTTIPQRSSP